MAAGVALSSILLPAVGIALLGLAIPVAGIAVGRRLAARGALPFAATHAVRRGRSPAPLIPAVGLLLRRLQR